MPTRAHYTLVFAPETVEHQSAIERKYHRIIAKNVDEQLSYTPDRETRNRKPLEHPASFGATWELRCGPNNRFRVFYNVVSAERLVRVLAISVKEGNRLFIGGKEIQI